MYRELDPSKIIDTAARLRDRIRERFPQANLGNVADELLALARAHAERSAAMKRPHWPLRMTSWLLLLCGIGCIALLLVMAWPEITAGRWDLQDKVQSIESGTQMLFFLGAGAVFMLSLELRVKRRRCLEAVHELRAMAHIVDMHQLTKDPDRVLHAGPSTPASPVRTMTAFELTRYLDYCTEMLSLMGKVAALYGQNFPDQQAMEAVDEVEDLTTSLARKIWQKIMILEQAVAPGTPPAGGTAPATTA